MPEQLLKRQGGLRIVSVDNVCSVNLGGSARLAPVVQLSCGGLAVAAVAATGLCVFYSPGRVRGESQSGSYCRPSGVVASAAQSVF